MCGPVDFAIRGNPMTRELKMVMAIISSAALSSCDDSRLLSAYDAVSPDGTKSAEVQTKEFDGPGASFLSTNIRLNLGSKRALNVLTLEHDQRSSAAVITNWRDSDTLDVYYFGGKVDFLKSRVGDVQILAHDISRTPCASAGLR